MASRVDLRMTDEEIAAFLAQPLLCRIGTFGPGGSVHMVAMNYGFLDGVPAFWTYRRAQKVKNLERNPAIGMLVDTGSQGHDLKGVHLMGTAELRDDEASVLAFWASLAERYGVAGADVDASASKRLVVMVHADKVLSWDHGKASASR